MFVDFRERGVEMGRERKKTSIWEGNIDWLPPVCTPTGDWTRNLGTSPQWEPNLHPFGVQDNVPPNWANQGQGSDPPLLLVH